MGSPRSRLWQVQHSVKFAFWLIADILLCLNIVQRAEGFYRLSVIRALIPFIRVLPLSKGPTSKYIRVSISTCEFWRGTKLAVLKGIAK